MSVTAYPNGWEIDWDVREPEGAGRGSSAYRYWSRKANSKQARALSWRFRSQAQFKVRAPRTSLEAWEVRWEKRRGGEVWARNPTSRTRSARDWHWASRSVLWHAGFKAPPRSGRRLNSDGYIIRAVGLLSGDERACVEKYGLAHCNGTVPEHRLVAAMHIGDPTGKLVRHLNGDKADNRPENLALGDAIENNMDHFTAFKELRQWKQRALEAEAKVIELEVLLAMETHGGRAGLKSAA